MGRIAVLISGQLRNWKIALDSQKWFYNTSGMEVDYFVHTWNYSMDRPSVSAPYNSRAVEPQEYLEFCEAYKPKKALFDDKTPDFFYANDHWSSLFYSFVQTVLLKRQYELENNIEYEAVFKTRPDVCYNPEEPLKWAPMEDNMFYTTHGGLMPHEHNSYNLNDCVFGANSYTMDILVNLYFYRQNKINDNLNRDYNPNFHSVGPGVLMHDFMREYGITPLPHLEFIETLVKEGCPEGLHLLDADQWMVMEKYFRNWYNT